MGLLSKVEAAIKLGVSIELIEYFIKKCPKSGQKRKLAVVGTAMGDMIDENELLSFQKYLNEPWPLPASGQRPIIPEPIKEDIRQESHLWCAICGYANGCEVAHIYPTSDTLNNSPENLIYLCPNHHTEYDLGYKHNTNVTLDEVNAAKLMKRNARIRMLLCEANITKAFYTMSNMLAEHKAKLEKESNQNMVAIYEAESRALLAELPAILDEARKSAKKDKKNTELSNIIEKHAPEMSKALIGNSNKANSHTLRTTMDQIVRKSKEIFIELDEMDCPHCGGRGTTGICGNICSYCKGECGISEKKALAYDRDAIDEVICPHCDGNGTTGIGGYICSYCKGACAVSKLRADIYNRDNLDEVDCPHCGGSGTTGIGGYICKYCKGACGISSEKAAAYKPDKLDEEDCPHCGGNGTTGIVGDICRYCRGECRISKKKVAAYNSDAIDEVACPHCDGNGTTGIGGHICKFCRGSCVVDQAKYDAYIEKYGNRIT